MENTKSDLEALVQLQELDLQLVECDKTVERLPEQLADIAEKLDRADIEFQTVVKTVEESHKQRRLLESEVEDLGEQLRKFKTQLMEVKTNEAYQALLHEIDFAEKNISRKEDQILEKMVEVEELEGKQGEAGRLLKDEKEKLVRERSELEKNAREAEERLDTLRQERDALCEQIRPERLAQYDRISQARNGLALAQLDGHSCQACHVRLRPQLIAEVRSGKTIVPCENCSRILYSPPSVRGADPARSCDRDPQISGKAPGGERCGGIADDE